MYAFLQSKILRIDIGVKRIPSFFQKVIESNMLLIMSINEGPLLIYRKTRNLRLRILFSAINTYAGISFRSLKYTLNREITDVFKHFDPAPVLQIIWKNGSLFTIFCTDCQFYRFQLTIAYKIATLVPKLYCPQKVGDIETKQSRN